MKFKQFLYKYFIAIFSLILTAATIAVFTNNAFSNELRNNLNNVWLEQSPDNSVNVVLEVNKAFASNPNLVKKDDRTYLLIMPSTDTSINRDIDVRGFEKYVSSLKVDYVKYNSSKENGYTKVTIKAEPNVHFKVKSQFEKSNITKYPLVGAAFAGLLALFIFLGFRNFIKKPNENEQSAYAAIAQEDEAEQLGSLEVEEVSSVEMEEESQNEQSQQEEAGQLSNLEDEDDLEEVVEETEIAEATDDILEEDVPEDVLDLFEEESDSEAEQLSSLEDEDDLEEAIEETEIAEATDDILEENVPEDVLDLFEEESDSEAEQLSSLEDEDDLEEVVEETEIAEATDDILEEDVSEDVLDLFEEESDSEAEQFGSLEVEETTESQEEVAEESSEAEPEIEIEEIEAITPVFEEEEDISMLENEQESTDEQSTIEEDADDIFEDISVDTESFEDEQSNNPDVEEFSDKDLVEIVDGEVIEETSEDELDELFNTLEEETILPENISDSADFVVEESFNNPFKADSIDIESFIGHSEAEQFGSLEVGDDFAEEPTFEPEEIVETEGASEDEQLGSLEAQQFASPEVKEEETIDTESFFKNEPQEEVVVEEFFVAPSQKEIIEEPEIEPEQEEIEEVDDSEPLVLAQKEIDKDKMLYLIRHEGVFSLIGIRDDNVFVLHRFEEPIKTYEIIVKLNEQKDNQNIYIVKINNWRALIGVEQSAIELILEL